MRHNSKSGKRLFAVASVVILVASFIALAAFPDTVSWNRNWIGSGKYNCHAEAEPYVTQGLRQITVTTDSDAVSFTFHGIVGGSWKVLQPNNDLALVDADTVITLPPYNHRTYDFTSFRCDALVVSSGNAYFSGH